MPTDKADPFPPQTADFRAEARRQATAVALSPQEPEDQAFIDAVSDRTETVAAATEAAAPVRRRGGSSGG